MIAGFARVMVNAAARRWPVESEVRREWLAELDFLAGKGSQARMLWFAAGLAFARPAHAPAIGLNWRTIGTTFSLLAAVLTISITTTMSLPWILRTDLDKEYYLFHEMLTGIGVWPIGLFGVLFLLARAAQTGCGRWAVVAGFVAWLVILDIAVMVDFLPNVGKGQDPIPGVTGIPLGRWEAEHAPMWFVGGLTGQSFGVLNAYEREDVLDDLVFMQHLLVVFGIYAMSFVFRAARKAGD